MSNKPPAPKPDDKPKLCKIRPSVVAKTLITIPVHMVAGHLDLEGICFIKILRTGPDECFAADVTQLVLKGEIMDGKTMTHQEIERMFWRVPACQKWGNPE